MRAASSSFVLYFLACRNVLAEVMGLNAAFGLRVEISNGPSLRGGKAFQRSCGFPLVWTEVPGRMCRVLNSLDRLALHALAGCSLELLRPLESWCSAEVVEPGWQC